jgi:Rrf2 family transcriptional regulator, iron-sulfur cluster assembly transcription factor
MNLLPRRSLLAVAAVVDIAHHARPAPISAKTLSARHGLPPRHLETLLQTLVRAGILKGVRGPRGGYELARERRRITVGAIIRAGGNAGEGPEEGAASTLVDKVVLPLIDEASTAFLEKLDEITVEDLCRAAEKEAVFGVPDMGPDFSI